MLRVAQISWTERFAFCRSISAASCFLAEPPGGHPPLRPRARAVTKPTWVLSALSVKSGRGQVSEALDFYLLDLVEAYLVIAPVIQSCHACAFVAGELLRELQCAFVRQVVRYARRPECVTAYLLADTGIVRAALHHADRIVTVHRMARQLPRSFLCGSEEGSLLLFGYAHCLDVLVQIFYQIMMGEHLMELAALFVQTHSPLHAALTEILDRHVHDARRSQDSLVLGNSFGGLALLGEGAAKRRFPYPANPHFA